ncbi:alpha/beta hydrolase family protein [Pseudomonas sessilinigenes]|uniref:Alpha/beta hydrolase n=1 Tax=Pseudomonas sessilinigenes TaxID=658629 RepID=A0ABX8MKT2_9PSED|nr:alpha/beta hydrolase [Pseudomonas sessilinigenes]AZC26679.1 Alpha/beta superfamily hydrolase [Pseudomonas sessilinigenes]QXH39332.1 alpha/beta hydrolase [Pseudomonas sessilinigenes]
MSLGIRWACVLLLAVASLASATPEPSAPLPAPQYRQLARPDGSRIDYYLLQRNPRLPAQSLLVILQGSDCNSVSRIPSIRKLLLAMPEADVLTVEKYGIDATLPYDQDSERTDCPAPYLLNDSPSQRVTDLQAVIEHLRQRRAYPRIVALGGSEGAVIAHALAARSPAIDATVAFNGGGRWFLDDLLHSVDSAGGDPAQQHQARQGLLAFVEQMRRQPAADVQASGHGSRWWQEVLELDQQALLQASRVPALIIQASADEAVSVNAVTDLIEQLRRNGRSNLTFRAYPGLDHRLSDRDGQSQMAAVVQDIALWLRQLPTVADEHG